MFNYIIANLSPEYATEIHDLILRPPSENPYDKVKEQLIKELQPQNNVDYKRYILHELFL